MHKFLRNPEFGNTWKLNNNTIFHRTMSGELRTAVVAGRPVFESFTVTIKSLSQDQINAFKDFVIASAGQEVNMTDFENRLWVGVILDEILRIKNYGKMPDCQYEVSFSFEGQIQ